MRRAFSGCVRATGALAGGTVAVSESYGRLVAEVGTVSRQAESPV